MQPLWNLDIYYFMSNFPTLPSSSQITPVSDDVMTKFLMSSIWSSKANVTKKNSSNDRKMHSMLPCEKEFASSGLFGEGMHMAG